MGAFIRPRGSRSTGVRFQVLYRTGGRNSPVRSAGTFASAADAERVRCEVAGRLAACAPATSPSAVDPLVYIAELGGLLKIGLSIDPARRCRELHADLLHVEVGGRARERELHQRFAHLRDRGEFFRPGRFGEIRRYVTRMQGTPSAVTLEAVASTRETGS